MKSFISFLRSLPNDCILDVRISDNVLEEEDWGIDQLTITFGMVRYQSHISEGVYSIPDMVGWTTVQVCEWSHFDKVLSHPEWQHEVRIQHLEGGAEE